MAAHSHKRHAFGPGIAALVVVMLLSSLSPCFALCTAAQEAAQPAPEASAPSCHEAPATPATREIAAPGAPACSENPSASRCCCLTERSATTVPGDVPMVVVTRDAAPSAPLYIEYIATADHPAYDALHLLRVHADRSPPGTPIFIAHHALLI